MKIPESKLRSIIREELSRLTERLDADPSQIEVYGMANPEAHRHGGPEGIEVFVKPDGRGGYEFVEALGPPGQPIETPAFNRDYGEILTRKIEQGKGENVTDYYTPSEIEDRLQY